MTPPPEPASRLWQGLFGAAIALPSALFAGVVALALAGPVHGAEPAPACTGTSLLPKLEASGRLAPLRAKADAIPNGKGRLFRIEREGLAPSYLYGTMHMTDERVVSLEPAAEAGLSASDRLVIETTDILGGPAAQLAVLARPDLLNLPAGKTLGDYLGDADRRVVEEKLKTFGIPFASIQTLQPWFFSVGFLLPACEAQRQAGGAEVLDVALATRAQAAGKPVLGLETAIEQLEAMASLSMDLQIRSLVATLEMKPEMPDIFETMIQLYLAGDVAMISEVAEAAMPLGGDSEASVVAYAEFEDRIVAARNHVMAERLHPILEKGGTFVAIGALHLPGKTGLVELLKAEGYRLTRAD